MNRRGFLAGILAAGVAPATARAGILMPVKQIVLPPYMGVDFGTGDMTVVWAAQSGNRGDTIVTRYWAYGPDGVVLAPTDVRMTVAEYNALRGAALRMDRPESISHLPYGWYE